MTSLLIIIQFVLVAIICICVLLQKSSNMGLGTYSGSNESLFGAKGPAGFLAKFTFIIGLLFLINTLSLGYLYNKPSSIIEELQQLPKKDLHPVGPILPAGEKNAPFTSNLPVNEANTATTNKVDSAKNTKPAKEKSTDKKSKPDEKANKKG